MKALVILRGVLFVFITFVVLTGQAYSGITPEHLAHISLYTSPDGIGAPSDYKIYYNLWTPPDANSFYYTSGYSTPNSVSVMRCILTGMLNQYAVESIERTSVATGINRCMATAQYNNDGRILQIEQVNKDPCEPNDVIMFYYTDKLQMVKAELCEQLKTTKKKEMLLDGYCNDCPRALRKRPSRCTYSNLIDPNQDIEVYTSYDTEKRMASIIYKLREHDHVGQFNFAYSPEGRLVMMSNGLDDDCDGYYETPMVAAMMHYDPNGRLIRIYDSVSDSNIFEWRRTTISDTNSEEEIRIRSIFGDPNVSTFTTMISDDMDSNTYDGDSVITVPDTGGSIQIRDWNWLGEDSSPQLVSADVNWASLDPGLGDPNLSNRIILPLLNPNGLLAATLDAQEVSICSYRDESRKQGTAINRNGSSRNELHFYDMVDDGNVAAMLTMDEYGNAIIGIAGGGDELMRYNFFEAWPCKWEGTNVTSPIGGGDVAINDAWNWRNNPERYNFFEAWPSSWGIQPYVPIYSETGDGTTYLAGSVTPGGAYCYLQYDENGRLEAIVRMNSVDAIGCTEEIEGDANGDCKINLLDFAVMAGHWLECNLEYQETCW